MNDSLVSGLAIAVSNDALLNPFPGSHMQYPHRGPPPFRHHFPADEMHPIRTRDNPTLLKPICHQQMVSEWTSFCNTLRREHCGQPAKLTETCTKEHGKRAALLGWRVLGKLDTLGDVALEAGDGRVD